MKNEKEAGADVVEVKRIEFRDSPIVGKGALVVTVAADVTRDMIELPEKELIEGISSDVGTAIARAIMDRMRGGA